MMTALTTHDALVALTTQAMVTGYVTLLAKQAEIQRNLGAGMTPGDSVIAALGDEPAQFLDTRRDLAERFIDAATLADDEALVERIALAINAIDNEALERTNFGQLGASYAEEAQAALRTLATALAERGGD